MGLEVGIKHYVALVDDSIIKYMDNSTTVCLSCWSEWAGGAVVEHPTTHTFDNSIPGTCSQFWENTRGILVSSIRKGKLFSCYELKLIGCVVA